MFGGGYPVAEHATVKSLPAGSLMVLSGESMFRVGTSGATTENIYFVNSCLFFLFTNFRRVCYLQPQVWLWLLLILDHQPLHVVLSRNFFGYWQTPIFFKFFSFLREYFDKIIAIGFEVFPVDRNCNWRIVIGLTPDKFTPRFFFFSRGWLRFIQYNKLLKTIIFSNILCSYENWHGRSGTPVEALL